MTKSEQDLKDIAEDIRKLKLELANYKGFVEDIKAIIPANYPYRSNCSSPFCKIITCLRLRGLEK